MNKFSIFIPTYNAEAFLGPCLESIFRQDYPREKIEVVIVDGGSTDRTYEIAMQFPVRFLENPDRLAHYAFRIYGENADADLVVMFAADNELYGTDWMNTANLCFEEFPDLAALWGRQVSGEHDKPVNKYFALIQSEPLSFFTNKHLDGYLIAGQSFSAGNKQGKVFQVDSRHPLVWGANGLILKLEYVRKFFVADDFIGDNDIFQNMIEENHNRVAFISDLHTIHHHVRSVGEWAGKFRRNYAKHFLEQRKNRNMRWAFNPGFFRRFLLWLFYASIPVFSGIHALWLAVREKNIYWLYHPVLNFVQVFIYTQQTLFSAEGRSFLQESLFRKSKIS